MGRVTLLGNACHPMLPFMAQGAAQALEDGVSLAACLAKISDVPAALRHYEKMRLPRTSRIQGMSAANKTRFHLPDGPARKSGTQKWLQAVQIIRSKPSHGSTTTTLRPRLKPETLVYRPDFSQPTWLRCEHQRALGMSALGQKQTFAVQ